MSKIPPYIIPTEKIRQNRQIFYELHRGWDEDIKLWFNRIQRFARHCKFTRRRQFLIIDRFICELKTDEIERISHVITDSWTLQELNKYFVDEQIQRKHTASNTIVNYENADENEKSPSIKCEVDDYNEYAEENLGDAFGNDDNTLIELIPYVSEDDEEELHENAEEADGLDHEISTPVQNVTNHNENGSNVNVPITPTKLEEDFGVNHEILLDTIKCELDGYEYATPDQLEFEVRNIQDVLGENGHGNQSKSTDSDNIYQSPSQFQTHFPQHQATSNAYSSCYIKLDDGTFTYQCDECDKTFTRSIGLKHHKQAHHHSSSALTHPFACGFCDNRYATTTGLNTHMHTHGAIIRLHKLKARQRKLAPVKTFTCELCGKSFKSSAILQYHKNVHTGAKPYACDRCDKSFAHRSNLLSHKKGVHYQIRQYVCPVCKFRFSSGIQFKYHLRTHSAENPYVCNLCDESFSSTVQLTQHKINHRRQTGEFKSYHRSSSNLRKHLQNHQMEGSLEKHELEHHT